MKISIGHLKFIKTVSYNYGYQLLISLQTYIFIKEGCKCFLKHEYILFAAPQAEIINKRDIEFWIKAPVFDQFFETHFNETTVRVKVGFEETV